ncbi:elongation factor 1-gamma [Drosophila persimilis]|uniref:Elongation factor 1-gamma n=1 Tax=Drosophila pseudoobscura pseudoobscura TaxID=46245 RepID=A0A6I8UM56_DROPS|nr:elongation factor 1-gamma [Drosophila pseudoobscura]XP_026850461.1 elongation factor 1-gamma [Drosophila persimilis]
MSTGTLYTYPENFRAYKALIAAQYSGAKVKVADNFKFGETNKSAEFLKKFPSGKVPAFETADGKYLSESNAIAYFLASEQLRGGKCPFVQAQVQQWISFADNEIVPASCALVFPLLGILPQQRNSTAKQDVEGVLAQLNQKLLNVTYLAGERITLADIIVFSSLLHLYEYVLEPTARAEFGNVNRWFLTILNQPQVQAVVKDYKLCEKALVFDPKKYAEFQAKQGGGKPQQQQKPKEEKKPKEKKEAAPKKAAEPEELDAADEALALEPKSKDPFDALPKGTFNFDDFKRVYSNEEEAKSIPYFFEKFDPENYSIWFGEYKYSEELSKVFMSCNLITGMFQRLDKMRKQAFASVCLFGDDNNSTISGVWVWRGQELAFPLSPDWQIDYEVYDWKKLDAKSEETKKLVTQYFSWSGTDKGGRKFNQGKIFK